MWRDLPGWGARETEISWGGAGKGAGRWWEGSVGVGRAIVEWGESFVGALRGVGEGSRSGVREKWCGWETEEQRLHGLRVLGEKWRGGGSPKQGVRRVALYRSVVVGVGRCFGETQEGGGPKKRSSFR